MSVNWLLVLLLALGFVLIRLAVTGRYSLVWGALSSFPLTPAQAQAASQQANNSQLGFNRIG